MVTYIQRVSVGGSRNIFENVYKLKKIQHSVIMSKKFLKLLYSSPGLGLNIICIFFVRNLKIAELA